MGQDVWAAAVRRDGALGLGAGPVGGQVADDQHLDVGERVQVLQVRVADDPTPMMPTPTALIGRTRRR
jgi:hypothetical protein